MPGPLPDPNAQRRNKPTIPTTTLPAKGRRGVAPKPPAGYDFGDRALAWWKWAWKTPQAAGWSKGDLYLVARRAELEDDLGALRDVDGRVDLAELLGLDPDQAAEQVDTLTQLVRSLKAIAGGDLAVKREAREIDDRLGLTPKGMAALRWKIVAEEEAAVAQVRTLRPVPPPGEDPRRLLGG